MISRLGRSIVLSPTIPRTREILCRVSITKDRKWSTQSASNRNSLKETKTLSVTRRINPRWPNISLAWKVCQQLLTSLARSWITAELHSLWTQSPIPRSWFYKETASWVWNEIDRAKDKECSWQMLTRRLVRAKGAPLWTVRQCEVFTAIEVQCMSKTVLYEGMVRL